MRGAVRRDGQARQPQRRTSLRRAFKSRGSLFSREAGPESTRRPGRPPLGRLLGRLLFFPRSPASFDVHGEARLRRAPLFFFGGGLGRPHLGLSWPDLAFQVKVCRIDSTRAKKTRRRRVSSCPKLSRSQSFSKNLPPPLPPRAKREGGGLRRRQSAASGSGRAEAFKRLAIPTNSTNSERNPSLSAPTEPFANRSTSSHVIVPVMFPPRSS